MKMKIQVGIYSPGENSKQKLLSESYMDLRGSMLGYPLGMPLRATGSYSGTKAASTFWASDLLPFGASHLSLKKKHRTIMW
jgi:hypothetical protein